jgi:hypothetical protein
VADEFYRQLACVRAGDRQLFFQGWIEALVSDERDVTQLLAGVLQRLVDERELLAHPEAKPVRADDAQERREAKLPRFRDDDPPAPLPVDQVDDLSLLRARHKLDYRPIAGADRVEPRKTKARVGGYQKVCVWVIA